MHRKEANFLGIPSQNTSLPGPQATSGSSRLTMVPAKDKPRRAGLSKERGEDMPIKHPLSTREKGQQQSGLSPRTVMPPTFLEKAKHTNTTILQLYTGHPGVPY